MRREGFTFETLEDRRMLSASVVKHPVVKAAPVKPAVVVKPHKTVKAVKATKKKIAVKTTTVATPVAWNDLVGTWTGTFTTMGTTNGAGGSFSVTFQPRWIASNTGTYNVGAMCGQSTALTTVTPDNAGNVLVYIPLKNGDALCFVGGLSYSGKFMSGRWSVISGTHYTTGTFQLTRP